MNSMILIFLIILWFAIFTFGIIKNPDTCIYLKMIIKDVGKYVGIKTK